MKSLGDAAIVDLSHSPARLAFQLTLMLSLLFFFPGGNIGELAVYGTVNDLSMVGAKPLCMSAGLILEEGFLMKDPEKDSRVNGRRR